MSVDGYAVRPTKDKRGRDLISDALPFGPLWYGEPNADRRYTARRHSAGGDLIN